MKYSMILAIGVLCTVGLIGCVSADQTSRAAVAPLTSHDIINMSKAGINDSVIVTMISTSGSRFTLNADSVIALSHAGVSHYVINAMLCLFVAHYLHLLELP